MIATSTSETLWAEHGLTGLVLFALFGLIALFIKVITKKDEHLKEILSEKDEQLKEIITDEREERKRTVAVHAKTTDKLSAAIEGLSKELNKKK